MNRSWRAVLGPVVVTLMIFVLGVPPASATYATKPSPSWVPANGRVFAMATDGDRIYLGGTFTQFVDSATGETMSRPRLAAVDAQTGELVTGWNPRANKNRRSVAVDPAGVVYAGGDFTTVRTEAAVRLAAITPTVAAWTAGRPRRMGRFVTSRSSARMSTSRAPSRRSTVRRVRGRPS